jgi:ketosteroid isomerase-like protein
MNTPKSQAEQAIRAARVAQNDAIARADFDEVQRFWTEDVTVRRALGEAVQGIADARRVLEQAAHAKPALVYERLSESVQVADHWPLAYEEGVWRAHLGAPSDGGELAASGRYAAQWVCRNGAWLIRSEVFVALMGSEYFRGVAVVR